MRTVRAEAPSVIFSPLGKPRCIRTFVLRGNGEFFYHKLRIYDFETEFETQINCSELASIDLRMSGRSIAPIGGVSRETKLTTGWADNRVLASHSAAIAGARSRTSSQNFANVDFS